MAREFDDDPRTIRCFRYCDSPNPNDEEVLRESLRNYSADLSFKEEEVRIRQDFDHMFRFFSRLGCCVEAGTLTLDDASQYLGYLVKTVENPHLANYCRENGFLDVLVLAKRLLGYAANRDKKNREYMCMISDYNQYYQDIMKQAGFFLPRVSALVESSEARPNNQLDNRSGALDPESK